MENHDIQAAKASLGNRAAEIIVHGLGLEKWDTRNMKACCPFHAEKTPSFVWHKAANSFKCFGCGASMDILDFYKQTMTFPEAVKALCDEVGITYRSDYRPITKPYRRPVAEKTADNAVTEYLGRRGISKRTIDYAGVKSDGRGNMAFEYISPAGELLTVKYRPAKKVGKGENKNWAQKDKDTTPLLYGMEKADTTKPLLICEGEIDRLSAIEAGFANAVSVPFGAGNFTWIDHNIEWLDRFEKIIFWADADEAGEKMVRESVPRLGEHRCYVVGNLGQWGVAEVNGRRVKLKDINEVLHFHGKNAVTQLVEAAKDTPISHIIDIADIEDFDINAHEKISTSIKGLDKWLHGFLAGSVNIITGTNGAGKSTLINQMCIAEPLQKGYKTFVFSAEMPNGLLRSWINQQLAGPKNVEAIDNGAYAPKGYRVPYGVKQRIVEWYRGKVYFYDNDDDFKAASILQKMTQVARKYGVRNFVIDSLMLINFECDEREIYRRQTEFVQELVRFARQYRAVIHFVAHPRKTHGEQVTKMDVAGSANLTNLVHYVMSIHRIPEEDRKNDKTDKDVCLSLFKNRPLGFSDKNIGLYYDVSSKRFYGEGDDLNRKYGWENEPVQQSLDDPPYLEGVL